MIDSLNRTVSRLVSALPIWVGILLLGSAGAFYFWLINANSVNLLFLDHWDLYAPLLQDEHPGLWQLFAFQHGPHRQGVGWMLQLALDTASGMNMRWISIASGVLTAMAGGVFFTALRDFIPRVLLLITLGILCFSPMQWEVFAATPNLSHGPMPLLLLALYCKVLVGNSPWRWPLLLALNFGLVFTAFGLFAGFFTPLILLLEPMLLRRKRLLYLGLALVSLLLFFVDYHDVRAASAATQLHGGMLDYLAFLAHALSNAVGARGAGLPSVLLGGVLLTLMLWAWGSSLSKLFTAEPNHRAKVVVFLVGFTLLFLVNLAIGRISSGVDAGKASRYFPYLVPGLLGLLIALSDWKKSGAMASSLLLVGLLMGYFRMDQHLAQMAQMKDKKQRWITTYQITHSISAADAACGCVIHPNPEKTHLQEKLDYLESHGLSFFRSR